VDQVNKDTSGVGCWTFVGKVEYIESFGRETGSKRSRRNKYGQWGDIIQIVCKDRA